MVSPHSQRQRNGSHFLAFGRPLHGLCAGFDRKGSICPYYYYCLGWLTTINRLSGVMVGFGVVGVASSG